MSAHKSLLIILCSALVIRVLAAVIVTGQLEHNDQDFLIAGDAGGYWELGGHIARGEPYRLLGQPGDPLADVSIPREVARMPGFPALLGLIRSIVGDSLLGTRLVLAVVGTLACYLVYLLGCRIHGPSVGLAASAACAVSPTLAGFSVLVLSETLFAVMLLACLLAAETLCCRASDLNQRPQLSAALWTGLASCAAVYVRPGWLAAVPLFAVIWIAFSVERARATVEAAVLVLVVAVGLLPWVWRNQQVTGHPVLTTLWAGPSLYDGLRPTATGHSDMQFIIDDGLFADPNQTEYAIDRHYRNAAWEFTRTQPGTAAWLGLAKCWRFLKPWPSADQFGLWWQVTLVAVPTLVLYLLAVRGAWIHRQQPWTWLLAAGPLLYFAALHTVFVGSLRYRIPAEYSLWILAAAGWRRRATS